MMMSVLFFSMQHNVLLQRRQQSSGFQEASQPARRGSASAGAPSDTDGKFSAVLMDFGSTRTAHFQISSRAQALELQEDAEVCRSEALSTA